MKKLILLFLVSVIIISGCLTAPEESSYLPDATTEIANELPVALVILNTPRLSNEFYFQEGHVLSPQGIAHYTDLNANQICFGLEEFAENENFEVIAPEGWVPRILYNGKENLRVRSSIICSSDKTELIQTLDEFDLDWKIDIKNCDMCPDNETCCAIILHDLKW